jgi:hypothetical protein
LTKDASHSGNRLELTWYMRATIVGSSPKKKSLGHKNHLCTQPKAFDYDVAWMPRSDSAGVRQTDDGIALRGL